ncbi:sugar ABC transporter substrate-binding protein [Clostridium sp. DL1XJH146]
MIKRLINIITLILITVLIGIGVLGVLNFTKLSQITINNSHFDRLHPPKYRFMVIVDGTDSSYIEEFKRGIDRASTDYSVALEIWSFKGDQKEENILKQFDIAIKSKVDGVIIQTFDDDRFEEVFKEANNNNIPVITISSDIPSEEKVSFFSYNEYQIGLKVGELLNSELNKSQISGGTIVVLQNDQIYHYNQVIALKDQFEEKYIIKPEKVDIKGENILNAEGLTREIINKYEDLIGIICSSGEETLGVIQGLKDTNKMDDVMVFGFDYSKEILDYIDKGVITGTIIADNEKLGYEAIENMVKYNDEEFVSMYNDISVEIITKENLDMYIYETGEKSD